MTMFLHRIKELSR